MTERLTQRNEHGVIGTPHPMFLQEAIDKLAHYEDLEEQGRLHIVPKELWKTIMTFLANYKCPYEFELEGLYNGDEKECEIQSVGVCKECWEKALKGEQL